MNRVFACVIVVMGLAFTTARAADLPPSYPAPSPAEARLRAALKEDEPLGARRPLSDYVADMAQRHGIQIKLDEQALLEEGVSLDTVVGFEPVNGAPNRVSLRSALRLMLHEPDLTYIIRDGYLLVTTKAEAERKETCRVYPVGDLTLPGGFSSGVVDAKGNASRNDEGLRDYNSLIDLITTAVAPTTWEASGPGDIERFHAGHAIVIPQTAEVHEEIAEFLSALRAVRDRQRAAAVRRPEEVEPANEADDGWPTKIYRLLPGWYSRAAVGRRGMMGGSMGQMNTAEEIPVDGGGSPPAKPPTNGPGSSDGAAKVLAQMGAPGVATSPAEFAAEIEKLIAELATLLPELIDPGSWQAKGGLGLARALPGALVVKQTPSAHKRIETFLAELLPNLAYWVLFGDAGLPPPAFVPTLDWPTEPEPRPAPREAAIGRALAATVDFDFEKTLLLEMARNLARTYQIVVLVDVKSLEEENVALDLPITAHLRAVTLREALRQALKPLDMTFIVRDEVLLLTTTAEAEASLTTKVYPVYDLVYAEPAVARAGRGSRGADYDPLIQILSREAPNTWDNVGGPGTLQEYPICAALAVSQTEECHEQVERLLAALRDARRAAKADSDD